MSPGKFFLCPHVSLSTLSAEFRVSMRRIARALFYILFLAAIAQCIHDFPLLPDRIASHFGPSGAPNGWVAKTQFFIMYLGLLLSALFVEFWLHRTIANKPEGKLRLPNKAYWLAPERRAGTLGYFQSFFAWYGCAFLFTIAFAMGLTLRANLSDPIVLPTGPMLRVLSGFVLFNVFAVITMYRHFSITK